MALRFSCVLFALSLHGAAVAAFPRGPFVQNAGTSSIQIIWRTPAPASTSVEYGLTAALENLVSDDALVTNHVVALTNLAPGATYFYRVGSENGGGTVRSDIETFRTLKTEGPVSFLVFGDSGNGAAVPLVAAAMRQTTPDLVIHLGDIIYDGFNDSTAQTQFFNIFQDQMKSVPFYLIPGNHDISPGLGGDPEGTNFQNVFYLPTNSATGTELFYSFDHGDVHVACLFNPWFRDYVFTTNTVQYAWLTNDLAASPKPWKVLCSHLPLAHSGAHARWDYDTNGLADQTDMMRLLLPVAQQYGVQMVFGSHDHNFERFAPTNGLHHMVSGGGGRTLYNLTTQHVASAQFWPVYHFLRVSVTNDTMSIEAVNTNGVVFSSFSITKALPPPRLYHAGWHTPAMAAGPANDNDGNILGQVFDFAGPPIFPRAGQFSNLGRFYVNNDPTHLYLGFEQVMMYRGHNVFLFLESPRLAGVTSMAGLGNGLVDPGGQGADGLDCLENLSFTNFTPALGCLLGDEYADGQFRSFARSNLALNIGQGVWRLNPTLDNVPGARLQQFNRSPQNNAYLDGVRTEQNADFIQVAIPLDALGGLQAGDVIKVGAVVGGGSFDTNAQTRHLDTSVLGNALHSLADGRAMLEGVGVRLAPDPAVRVAIALVAPAHIRLSWNTVPGTTYTVEYAETLPDFQPLNDPRLPTTATSFQESLDLAAPPGGRGFYRVRVGP